MSHADSATHAVAPNAEINDVLLIERVQEYLRCRSLRLAPDAVLGAAWEQFYGLCHEWIRRFVISLRVRLDEVEECVQDVWLALMERLKAWRYDPARGRFRTWLYRIVVHKTTDSLRRRRRHIAQPLSVTDRHGAAIPSPISDPLSDCECRSDRETVHAVLVLLREQVSPLSYRIFHLRRVEERSVADVAALADLTPEQVRARQCRVEQRFRGLYREFHEKQRSARNARVACANH